MRCGSYTMLGHGDGAICGQPYMDDKPFVCASCKIKEVERERDALQDMIDRAGGICKHCCRPLS